MCIRDSFVNQIVDEDVPAERVAACPLTALEGMASLANPAILTAPDLFPGRRNSTGFDLTDAGDLARIDSARAPHMQTLFEAEPLRCL